MVNIIYSSVWRFIAERSSKAYFNLTLLVPMCFMTNINYIHSSKTSTSFYKVSTGYIFRPTWAIIRPYIWRGLFACSTFWDPSLL